MKPSLEYETLRLILNFVTLTDTTSHMKNILLQILAVFSIYAVKAQKNINLVIIHKLGNLPFAYNTTATNNLNQDFQITRMDYYISGITLVHDGGIETLVPLNTYILVKASNNISAALGSYNINNLEAIKFNIGVNAPTNNSDITLWPLSHPLSFQTPSMHWGWAAGYNFLCIEGKSGPNMSKNFQMHGMFNANYFEQQVVTSGKISGNTIDINLDADYVQALRNIDVEAGKFHHGENLTDLDALKNFRSVVFKAGTGIPINILEDQYNSISVMPNPSTGQLQVNNLPLESTFYVYDALGRIITSGEAINPSVTLEIKEKGLYFIRIKKSNQILTTKKVAIQ